MRWGGLLFNKESLNDTLEMVNALSVALDLKRCAGKQFEEGLVDVFIKLADADLYREILN